MSRKHGDATISPSPSKLSSSPSYKSASSHRAARLYPILSLSSVILLFLSAVAGIALSATVLFCNLESAVFLDPLNRTVFFIASCMSLVYVLTHMIAARTGYVKNYGSPKVYGKYVAGFAFLLARLGLPLWFTAATLAIFIAVNVGLDLSKGIQENIPWLNVIISISSIFILCAIIAGIEMSDRPFATIGLSQTWFIQGEDPFACSVQDEIELEKKRVRKQERKRKQEQRQEQKEEKKQQKVFQNSDPYGIQSPRILLHKRSMSMPVPLNTVFSDGTGHQMSDSPACRSEFAWKPPTRQGNSVIAHEAVDLMGLGAWENHFSMHRSIADISVNALAALNEIVLPSLPPRLERATVSQALVEQQRRHKSEIWKESGMRSPPSDRNFLDVPFQRPSTPLLTLEEEKKIMGQRSSKYNSDTNANYHLQMVHSSRNHTSTSRTSEFARSTYKVGDIAPSLPPMARLSTNGFQEKANSARPDSDVLPNEERRREPQENGSGIGFSEAQQLAYPVEIQTMPQSYHASNQYERVRLHEPGSVSPTSTARSDMYNFSRPRTSAAAKMQSKISKRLRATKEEQWSDTSIQLFPRYQTSPFERGSRIQQPVDSLRPLYPDTPRTARATSIRNLQERIGKKMMRRNESEARDIETG